jgi:4-amino-4-deoxy-L-arabinose transferase-like glycosyltransferase
MEERKNFPDMTNPSSASITRPTHFFLDPAFLFSAVYFLLLLIWLGHNRLFGLDEAIYAGVALGEARDHHWLPFFFHDKPFWEKPPLLMWLQGLSVWMGGATEIAVRFWSALAGAIGVYFTWRLGAYLGSDRKSGMVCALLLALQSHYLLYSRLATMDMAWVCCFLGMWWQLTKAFDPALGGQPANGLLGAGLWWVAAIWIKSWFALLPLPAVLLVLYFNQAWQSFGFKLVTRFFLPVFFAVLSWLLVYDLAFGKAFLDWEWNSNILARVGLREFNSLELLNYHCDFYGVLAQEGMAFLWPLLPLGLGLWVRDQWRESENGKFDPAVIIGSTFFFYYLLFLLLVLSTLINYILPLLPIAALSVAFLFRHREEGWVRTALALSCLLGAMNGWTHEEYKGWILAGSLVIGCLPFFPNIGKINSRWFSTPLVLLLLVNGIKNQDYLRHPPDPNHAWVAAVLKHPAPHRGDPLLFVGDHTNARVLEYYCDYHVIPVPSLPPLQPPAALLFQYQNEAVFLTAPEKKTSK